MGIGSVSKLFVATAVMQLFEQGALDLNTDINQYLTAFQIESSFVEAVTPYEGQNVALGFVEGLQDGQRLVGHSDSTRGFGNSLNLLPEHNAGISSPSMPSVLIPQPARSSRNFGTSSWKGSCS